MIKRLVVIASVILTATSLLAGQLSPALVQQLSVQPSDQPVWVWIKLPENPEVSPARVAAMPGATAAEQHAMALNLLKSTHAADQAQLVGHLQNLVASGKAQNVKQHWLVNVIEAQVAPSELAALAARADIETIYPVPKIVPISPIASGDLSPQAPQVDSITDNLKQIKANQAQTAGFTGAGRVICSFDTGIDGAHPALQNSWKGKGGTRADSAAAWYDPVYHKLSPHLQTNGDVHGTHTMGIMVARDATKSITYGVAPGAKWISALVIDLPNGGASIIDAFEWAADPDGNPNTAGDVPDVINHSWGYENSFWGCDDIFYDAIDKTEALGIVNIFAAGNDGPAVQSVRNPANRALDSIDCFAVGMVNSAVNPPTLDNRSSRGPSACNGAIKPNVVAPGVSIVSTIPGNQYTQMSGTSMAAPHVSGLVALLRQKNPAATVRQIKAAILSSTQKFTWTVPNNDEGWGEIDCMAALNALPAAPATPLVRIFDFVHPQVQPGDTLSGTVRLQNLGGAATAVTGSITGTDPGITIQNGTVSFGSIGANAIVNSSTPIRLVVSDTVTEGRVISLPFKITGSNFQTTLSLAVVVQPVSARMFASHTGTIRFTVSNFGALGCGQGSFWPADKYGFEFVDSTNDLFEGGIILGTSPTKVASGVHEYGFEPKMDFKVAPGGNMVFDTLTPPSKQYSHSIFNDSNASSPLGLAITQETYGFAAPRDNHIILRYIIRNAGASTVSGLKFGIYLDWDIATGTRDAGGYDAPGDFSWMAYNTDLSGEVPNLSRFRGLKLLDGELATALTGHEAAINIPYWGGNGFTDAEKYFALNNGLISADSFKTASTGLFQLVAAGPITLAPGVSDTVAFAIIAGATFSAIGEAAMGAMDDYGLIAQVPPSKVTLLYPPDSIGSAISNLLPTFQWSPAIDPNPGSSITYTLQYSKDSLFTAPTSRPNLTATSYTAIDSLDNGIRYWWRVIATDNTGLSSMSDQRSFVTDISTDVNDGSDQLPKVFALYQNYPNPFNPATVIAFDLPRTSTYSLTVFDIAGRTVYERKGSAHAGRVEIEWDAGKAASGVYFYRLTAGDFHASRKMLLLK